MVRVLSFLYIILFQFELGFVHLGNVFSTATPFPGQIVSAAQSTIKKSPGQDFWQQSIAYAGHMPARLFPSPVISQDDLKATRRRVQRDISPVEENLRNKSVMDQEPRDAEVAKEWDTLPAFITWEDTTGNNSLILQHKQSLLYRVMSQLPRSQQQALYYLTLSESSWGSRGLGGRSSIVLHMGGLTDEELAAVFVHEMGHVIDTGLLEGMKPSGASRFLDGDRIIYSDDPSVSFYQLSWKNNLDRKSGSTRDDFVSGYSMTDPFEDFAESYVMYVLHGKQFRSMLTSSSILDEKYQYLKNQVFAGQEYDTGSPQADSRVRVFDATLIAYSLKKLIGI